MPCWNDILAEVQSHPENPNLINEMRSGYMQQISNYCCPIKIGID